MAVVGYQQLQNNSSVGSALTDFKAVITDACLDASTKTDFFTAAAADGSNVRVASDIDGTTIYPFHQMFWDQAGEKFALRVALPAVTTGQNDIYLIIDDSLSALPADGDPDGKYACHAGFICWSDDGTEDLTGNHTMTEVGSPARTTDVFGNPTGAIDFDGTNDVIKFDSPTVFANPTGTVQAWTKRASGSPDRRLCLLHRADTDDSVMLIQNTNYPSLTGSQDSWSFVVDRGITGLSIEVIEETTLNTFELVSLTFDFNQNADGNIADPSDGDLFVNGVNYAPGSSAVGTHGIGTDTGADMILWGSRSGSSFFPGVSHGFRYTDTILSADYLAAQAANENNPGTFWVGQGYVINSSIPVAKSSTCPAENLAELAESNLAPLGNISLLEQAYQVPATQVVMLAWEQLVPVALALNLQKPGTVPLESLGLISQQFPAAIENLANVAREGISPVDYLANLRSFGTVPLDHQALVNLETIFPIEQLLDVVLAKTVYPEHLLSVRLSTTVPVIWEGALVVEQALNVPLSWLATIDQAPTMPVDTTAPVSAEGAVPAEHLANLQHSAGVPLEQLVRLAESNTLLAETLVTLEQLSEVTFERIAEIGVEEFMPLDWGGAMALQLSSQVPIEWLGGISQAAPIMVESVTLLVVEKDITTEQLTALATSRSIQTEMIAIVDRDAVLPITWDGRKGFIAGIKNVFKKDNRGAYFRLRGGRGVIFNRRN
ncbi:hypothetical protein [Emcibacter sp.]|uniref:hypothetical protein n=1 Tax=Emcibacter sp. TaxID=1979954 RepID=UPI002AA780BD|nr:hypothetical protein [Emcibacter sp.]